MSITLKPCPFCDGEAEIERYGDRRQSTIYHCTECGCLLETGETFDHGSRWNERRGNKDIEKIIRNNKMYTNVMRPLYLIIILILLITLMWVTRWDDFKRAMVHEDTRTNSVAVRD